jgi:hypothetical protein
MRLFSISRIVLFILVPLAAHAQSASPQQIQAQIAQGQESQALSELGAVLQAHPDSGVAWYLTAEAQDAAGNVSAARGALAKAEQFAPGLPFANQSDVAALQAHVSGAHHGGIGWLLKLVAIVFGLVLLVRFLFGGRRVARGAYGGGAYYPGTPGGGYGAPYGPAGGGLGSSLLGGLAAGAGFAAGERIIDDLAGGNRDQGFIDNTQVPDRDDGLNGSPGWDDPSNQGGNFDPDNTW